MFSYRSIMKKSWQVTRNHKALWFLGFLSIAFASGGEYRIIANILSQNVTSGISSMAVAYNEGTAVSNIIAGLGNIFHQSPAAFIWLMFFALIILGLSIFLIYIAINSQASLVKLGAQALMAKKKDEQLEFKHAWNVSKKHFWPVLSTNVLAKAINVGLLFIVGLPLLLAISSYGFITSFIFSLLFVALIPLIFSISLIGKYAINYNVLEDYTFTQSIGKAVSLFKKNWIVSLEMSFILFFINFLVGFSALVISFCLIMLPLIVPPLLFFLIINMIIALILIIVVGYSLNVFQTTSWTNLFLEMHSENAKSKIERMLNK